MEQRKTRGFRLHHKVLRVFKWCIHRRTRRRAAYRRLQPAAIPFSNLRKWFHSMKKGAKRIYCNRKSISSSGNYIRAGQEPLTLPESVPKGHLAVCVGDKEDDTCRVVVPVIYFNHPLFGELLREAEEVYGFNHADGLIQIPCPRSELESVRMRIAAVSGGGGRWRRR